MRGVDEMDAGDLAEHDVAFRRDLFVGPYPTPRGFYFNGTALPFTVTRMQAGKVIASVNPLLLMPASVWDAPLAQIFHVDPVSGSDTTGTGIGAYRNDFTAAVRTPKQAKVLGNLTGVDYQIIVKGDTNPVINRNDTGQGGSILETQNVAWFSYGGRTTFAAFDAHTWAVDGTYPDLYSVTESNCSGVFDLLNTRVVGSVLDYGGRFKTLRAEFAHATSIANLQASLVNAWFNTGGKTYLKVVDGRSVTDLTVRSHRASYALTLGSKSGYFNGFDFEGGLVANAVATRNLVFEDCRFRYAQHTAQGRGLTIDNMTGCVITINCEWDANGSDGGNGHGVAGRMYWLSFKCSAFDNGRGTSTSNNGITGHENVVWIDILGDYRYNRGGTVRFIDSSQLWMIGTFVGYDYGDLAMGGVLGPTEVRVDNNAQIFMDDCVIRAIPGGAALSTSAAARCAIWTRNVTVLNGTTGGNVYAMPT